MFLSGLFILSLIQVGHMLSIESITVTTGIRIEKADFTLFESTIPIIFEVTIKENLRFPSHMEHLDERYDKIMEIARSAILKARPLRANNVTTRRTRETEGLIPFVGKAANFLFGTSTQRETEILASNEET